MAHPLVQSDMIQYVVAAGAVLWFLKKFYREWTSPLSKLPGPWYAPWTNLMNTYVSIRGQKHLYTMRMHEQYGTVVRVGPDEIIVRSPSGAATIHQIKQPFLKGQFYRDFLPGIENIFNTTDPDFHRRHRRLLSSPLSESQLQTVFLPRIEAHFDVALSKMRHDIDTTGVTDVAKWFLYTATDIIGELSFGDSFHMLERDEVNQYIRDLRGHKLVKALRFAFTSVNSLPFAPYLPGFRAARAAMERNLSFARESLDRHKRLVEKNDEAGDAVYPTLFQKMYNQQEKDGEDTLTEKELVDDAGVYIVAGSDTTSTTLTYLVWAVCRHPEIQRELVAELKGLPDGYTQQDLKECRFMNLVIQETLRLYAAAPNALPRVVPPSGAEIDGHWLPGGANVSTSAYALHRDAAVFPAPEKFNPWRWEEPTKEMKDAFTAFGGGTRTCIGIHLAYIEIRLGVARFFREFPNAKVSTRDGMSDEDMEQSIFFLLAPKGHRCLVEA